MVTNELIPVEAMSGTKPRNVEMNNELLGQIFRRSAKAPVTLGAESEVDLLAAITATAQEDGNQGKEKLVVSLSHTLQNRPGTRHAEGYAGMARELQGGVGVAAG
jgi:hypothetical protein